ncbi:MAG: hypothetical protein GC131_03955 [Alphaproteobacteria bacterium]|nr:hypothetical protein [Alphaproteobacteria bacterium]
MTATHDTHADLRTVEVVDEDEHRTLAAMYDRGGDGLLKAIDKLGTRLRFGKNGKLTLRSHLRLAFAALTYPGNLRFEEWKALTSVAGKLGRFHAAYISNFPIPSEQTAFSSMWRRLVVRNYEQGLRQKIGFNKESTVMLVDHRNNVVAGHNYAAYGHDVHGADMPPSAFTIFYFVMPEWRQHGLGTRMLEIGDRLSARDLVNGGCGRSLVRHGLTRFIEVNDPLKMSAADIDKDLEGHLDPYDRVTLMHRLGFQPIDVNYLEPEYDVAPSMRENTGRTQFLRLFAGHRTVSIGESGNITLGARQPPAGISIDYMLAHIRATFEQNFGAVSENDPSYQLIKDLEEMRKQGARKVPMVAWEQYLAKLKAKMQLERPAPSVRTLNAKAELLPA